MLHDSVVLVLVPRRRRRRANALTSNATGHDNHEKINSWAGVLKTKTPKSPKTSKLENKDPPNFWGAPAKLRPAGRQCD